MARVSINKASLDFNISRNTLYKHIKQGKITKDADGKLDPRPTASGSAYTTALANLPAGDAFFSNVSHKGAFSANSTELWIKGWSTLARNGHLSGTATNNQEILSFDITERFKIYPNPVNEVLNLNTKQDTEVYSLTIYNLLGQQVQTITNPSNAIDVSSLETGNYILKIVTEKGVSSSKFIKE